MLNINTNPCSTATEVFKSNNENSHLLLILKGNNNIFTCRCINLSCYLNQLMKKTIHQHLSSQMSCIATGILVICLIKWSSVTVNNNSLIQDHDHLDNQTQPTFEMTPGFKPFTVLHTMLVTYDSRKYKIVLSKSAFSESNCTIQGIEIYPVKKKMFSTFWTTGSGRFFCDKWNKKQIAKGESLGLRAVKCTCKSQ